MHCTGSAPMAAQSCSLASRGAPIVKNLFLCNRQNTEFRLLLMPGGKPFKTKDLSKQIGSARLSFAQPDAMRSLLGVTPGSASVFGLLNDKDKRVQLLLDEEILSYPALGAHPCKNTSTLKVSFSDLTDVFFRRLDLSPVVVRLPNAPEPEEG